MKNDINLLQKRKSERYSGRKWAAIILIIVLIAGAAYAGIQIPGELLTAAQQEAMKLQSDIQAASGAGEDVSELSSEYKQRKEQLDALAAIELAQSDMSSYLDAVETACPSTVNVTYFTAAETTITVLGNAFSDEDIAAFCLHLRNSGKFVEVFLEYSTLMEDGSTMFSIELVLPASLDSSAVLPTTSEEVSQ